MPIQKKTFQSNQLKSSEVYWGKKATRKNKNFNKKQNRTEQILFQSFNAETIQNEKI